MATVASTTTSTALAATNTDRRGIVVSNDDANRLYVLMGAGTASSSNYSFSLAQNENAHLAGYVGPLTGVWSADGTGNAQITEY